MVTLREDYLLEWNLIEDKMIPNNKIDKFIILVLLDIIADIHKEKRDELDVGDVFGLGIQHAISKGYKFTPRVNAFLFLLGSYKDDPFETGEYDPRHNIDYVEKEAKKIYKIL